MKTLLLLLLGVICGGCVTVNHPSSPFGLPIPTKEQQAKHAETLKKNREYREETQRLIEEKNKDYNSTRPYPTSY